MEKNETGNGLSTKTWFLMFGIFVILTVILVWVAYAIYDEEEVTNNTIENTTNGMIDGREVEANQIMNDTLIEEIINSNSSLEDENLIDYDNSTISNMTEIEVNPDIENGTLIEKNTTVIE